MRARSTQFVREDDPILHVRENPFDAYTKLPVLGVPKDTISVDRVLVHGGGLSGLALGCFVKARGIKNFKIVEPHRPGGLLQTLSLEEGLRELAANGFIDGPAMQRLNALIGATPISSRRESARKYIVRSGKPVALPTSVADFLTGRFLGLRAKLGLLPDLAKFLLRGSYDPVETFYDFVARVFGTDIADTFAEPMAAGIYGTSARDLCTGVAFPRLSTQLERLARRSPSAERPASRGTLSSYARGMGSMVQAMTAFLEGHLVSSLPTDTEGEPRVNVAAVPAYKLGDVLPEELAPLAAEAQRTVRYVPLISVQAFVAKKNINVLEGFGVLIPPSEKSTSLGILFNDQIFEGRTSDSEIASLTFLCGGSRDPEALGLSDEKLVARTEEDARRLLGLKGNWDKVHIVRYERAIPQYSRDLGRFWIRADRILKEYNDANPEAPWLLFGNYTGQVAIRGIVDGALGFSERLHFQVDQQRGWDSKFREMPAAFQEETRA